MSKSSHGQASDRMTGTTRRRPRGEQGARRVDLILDAAEAVFGEAGFDGATTNAIAARAGVSIGSIYQYFPDKSALFAAVADRYRAALRALYDEALTASASDETWPALLDRLIDPLVHLEVRHAAFKAVLCGHSAGRSIHDSLVESEVAARIEQSLRSKLPKLSASSLTVVGRVIIASVSGVITSLYSSCSYRQQMMTISGLKRMLTHYLSSHSI